MLAESPLIESVEVLNGCLEERTIIADGGAMGVEKTFRLALC